MTNRQMITLQHDQKMAMVTSMDQMMKMGDQMGEAMGFSPEAMDMEGEEGDEEDSFSMKSTGQTKTINGFKCELFAGTDSDGDFAHIWVSKEQGSRAKNFIEALSEMEKFDQEESEGTEKENEFFKELNGFPILTKSVSMDQLNINEVLEISDESVPDDIFQIPAGYQQMNMQQMMQQQMKMMQEQYKKQREEN